MSEQFMSICLGLDVSSTLLRLPSSIYNSSPTAIVLSVQSSKCICTEYSTLKKQNKKKHAFSQWSMCVT